MHSDHLQGLESFNRSFIYCTPATREVLLKLEKYPHRVNFAKGVLESRKQTYGHLSKLLKTIPLEVPTNIELGSAGEICVTLFDACHCVGACMFLLQDTQGTAILYTGDVRCETWFVNSLVHNPLLIPWTLGPKRLDCIYLDTTFATKRDIHQAFPSKAEGLRELLQQVSQYSKETVFYVRAWTFGYEDVWVALSAALGSRVHLDRYKWRLYRSLGAVAATGNPVPREAAQLCGFKFGNDYMPGCLTNEETVRIHSCEKGSECDVIRDNAEVVVITPIITRTKEGVNILEPGAGGGLGDLSRIHELESLDNNVVTQLMALCATKIKDDSLLARILTFLSGQSRRGDGRVRLHPDHIAGLEDDDEMSIDEVIRFLRLAVEETSDVDDILERPKIITFPYSRHSSYSELCGLVAAFRPKDIYPCTVDEDSWTDAVSMRNLFGQYCSGDTFLHDKYMREQLALREDEHVSADSPRDTQETADELEIHKSSPIARLSFDSQRTESEVGGGNEATDATSETFQTARSFRDGEVIDLTSEPSQAATTSQRMLDLAPSSSLMVPRPIKRQRWDQHGPDVSLGDDRRGIGEWAYRSAAAIDGLSWGDFGGLESTKIAGESQEL